MIGNVMRAKDPAEANHPSKTPCGRLPTTEEKEVMDSLDIGIESTTAQ